MKEVGKYIERCNACQRYKNRSEALVVKTLDLTVKYAFQLEAYI